MVAHDPCPGRAEGTDKQAASFPRWRSSSGSPEMPSDQNFRPADGLRATQQEEHRRVVVWLSGWHYRCLPVPAKCGGARSVLSICRWDDAVAPPVSSSSRWSAEGQEVKVKFLVRSGHGCQVRPGPRRLRLPGLARLGRCLATCCFGRRRASPRNAFSTDPRTVAHPMQAGLASPASYKRWSGTWAAGKPDLCVQSLRRLVRMS